MNRNLQIACEQTWKSERAVVGVEDPNTYRQHRCGLEGNHSKTCICRYCGQTKSGVLR